MCEFQWDIMLSGGPVQSIANLAKGQDRGNAVTIQVSSFHPEVRVNVFFFFFAFLSSFSQQTNKG